MALSQHYGSFEGYKIVLSYYVLLYRTYNVMCYCLHPLQRFFAFEHYQTDKNDKQWKGTTGSYKCTFN